MGWFRRLSSMCRRRAHSLTRTGTRMTCWVLFTTWTLHRGAPVFATTTRGGVLRGHADELDPAMVRTLPHERAFVEPNQGDLVVVPAGWLRHWVPPIDGDSVRTV